MKRISTLLFLFICLFQYSFSQELNKKYCAFDYILNEINKAQPGYEQEIQILHQQLKSSLSRLNINTELDTVYTVQVVVHIVYLGNNKYENIPDDIIQSQIDALNRDFNALNEDTANLRSYFVPFRGNAKIKFELAKFRPNGTTATNGIERVQGKLGNSGGFSPITDNMKAPDDLFHQILGTGSGTPSWKVKNYLNIWVCDLNYGNRKCKTCLTLCDTCGALGGYSYPPADIPHWNQIILIGGDTIVQNSALDRGANDGIAIDFRYFGINNWFSRDSMSVRAQTRYSNGRTTVHEMGHYFGMRHTWGDAIKLDTVALTPDGCFLDDYIDDTPNSFDAFAKEILDPRSNPCDTNINSCSDTYLGIDYPDMFEDYMDYSSDLCYNLFTKQQVDFMRLILRTKRSGIIIKKEFSAPTLTQNIKLKDAGISFYPNPAKDILTVHIDKVMNKNLTMDIYDITGKILSSELIKQNEYDHTVNIKPLANGTYMVKFSTDGFTATAKFVKE